MPDRPRYRSARQRIEVTVTVKVEQHTFDLQAVGFATDETTTPDMILHLLTGVAHRARKIAEQP